MFGSASIEQITIGVCLLRCFPKGMFNLKAIVELLCRCSEAYHLLLVRMKSCKVGYLTSMCEDV